MEQHGTAWSGNGTAGLAALNAILQCGEWEATRRSTDCLRAGAVCQGWYLTCGRVGASLGEGTRRKDMADLSVLSWKCVGLQAAVLQELIRAHTAQCTPTEELDKSCEPWKVGCLHLKCHLLLPL